MLRKSKVIHSMQISPFRVTLLFISHSYIMWTDRRRWQCAYNFFIRLFQYDTNSFTDQHNSTALPDTISRYCKVLSTWCYNYGKLRNIEPYFEIPKCWTTQLASDLSKVSMHVEIILLLYSFKIGISIYTKIKNRSRNANIIK